MKQSSRWTVLFLIFLFTLAFGLVFQSIPPILNFIVSSLGLTYAQAGALMSLFALPGVFVSIPGGILANAYGTKRVGIVSLVIMFIGTLLVGLANGFPLLVVGRILSGIGAMTIAIVAPQTLSEWFGKKDLGVAMGIFHAALPVATILTLNTFGRLAEVSTWKLPVFLTAGYILFALLVFTLKYPASKNADGEQERKKPEFKRSFSIVAKAGWPAWTMALIWMVYNAAAISYLTFAGDYFISKGYSVGFAGFLASLFMIASLFLGPIIGSVTDRIEKEPFFIAGGCGAMALLIFMIPRSSVNPLLLGGLIGVASAMVPTPVFSLVPQFMPEGQTGLGFGMVSTLSNLGVLIGPFLVGLSYDRMQNHRVGFDLMALFALMAAVLALAIPIMVRKQKRVIS